MNSVSSIAAGALQAFSVSQQVTAHNMANISTDGFKSSNTIIQANGNGGVTAAVSGSQDSVDISREAVNMLSNSQGYKANLKVVQTADDMTRQLLNIKK